MAKSCFFTGRNRGRGMKISHSHKRTPRVLKANLQRRKVKIDGKRQMIWVSTRAIKAGKLTPYLQAHG